jgi:ubiquitin-protein ligase E3 A
LIYRFLQLRTCEEWSPGAFKRPLRVKFKGEEGVDAGGVSKEFYQLIQAQLFNPDYGS